MAYDVREIANFVLDVADADNQPVSNLRINKIIYFLHVDYLREYGQALVGAKIEAWDHGPVFREIYHQFKTFGSRRIEGRARRIEVSSGRYIVASPSLTGTEKDFLVRRCQQLLIVPAGVLVDMSHIEGGAWHIARFGSGKVNPGVEISNDLILRCLMDEARH